MQCSTFTPIEMLCAENYRFLFVILAVELIFLLSFCQSVFHHLFMWYIGIPTISLVSFEKKFRKKLMKLCFSLVFIQIQLTYYEHNESAKFPFNV